MIFQGSFYFQHLLFLVELFGWPSGSNRQRHKDRAGARARASAHRRGLGTARQSASAGDVMRCWRCGAEATRKRLHSDLTSTGAHDGGNGDAAAQKNIGRPRRRYRARQRDRGKRRYASAHPECTGVLGEVGR